MLKVLPILAGALFTLFACWSAGKILLDRLRLRFHPVEELFFRFVLGSSCFSLVIFCLTAGFLARRWIFLVVGLVPILFAALSTTPGTRPPALPALPKTWKAVFAIVLGVYGVFYFINALAPESSPDGSTYHLGLVARYLRQHGFGRITTNMYANLSEGLEMLFLPAFAIGKHSAAALVEFGFFVALPFGMLSYARRFGFPVAGVIGAVTVFCSPLFGVAGTSAYNDAAGVCVVFAAFYLLQIWTVERDNRLIPPIGLLSGFAFGIKYTLFLVALYSGCMLLWKLRRARQLMVRPMLIFSACTLLMVAPWLGKNWVVVANPFSPFLNKVFVNPYVTIQFEHEYAEGMRNRNMGVRERVEQAIWKGDKTGGFLGAAFLLSPLALFALRFAAGRQLLLAALLFFLPALSNIQSRFLMPCIPFLALALGMAVTQVPAAGWVFLAFPVLLGWPQIYPKYCEQYAWRLHGFPVKAAFRKVPEEKTLEDTLPEIRIVRMIDQYVPKQGKVFSFSSPPDAYSSRDIVVGYESAFGNNLDDLFRVPIIADFKPTRILTFAFPLKELRSLRVIQTARGDDRWSVAEMRVYQGHTEMSRLPSWRLAAEPNRWDIAYAFDNNPSTRWQSHEPIFPGMKISIDFGGVQSVDRVVLECSHDQWQTRLKLEGAGADGVWKALVAEPTFGDRDTDWNLRRSAVIAAKERGITHLLIVDGDYGADDYFNNRAEWGMELVGKVLAAKLYRLE